MRKYTVGALLLSSALAAPAFAADLGTDAGDTITNNFSVNYSVGGTGGFTETTDGTTNSQFVVDRKVNLVVTEVGGLSTGFTPSQDDNVTTFTVTNKTNDTMDYRLVASNNAGDDGDMANLFAFVESGANVGYQAGEDTATFIDELLEDESVTVYILADDNGSLTANGEEADVTLLAVSAASGTAATLGADLINDAANVNGLSTVDNVFADEVNAAANDATAAEDGQASSVDTYVFQTAALSLAKTSAVIWDPINAGTRPKMIPGAVVEYCLSVTNGGGTAATAVSFSDTIPVNATSGGSSTVGGVDWIAGANASDPDAVGEFEEQYFAIGGTTCGAAGTAEDEDADGLGDNGSFSGGVVSASIDNIPASETRVVRFRVTIR